MSALVVRSADAADLAAILTLERAIPEAPHWSETDYQAALEGETVVKRCLLVAESAGGLAGFAVGMVATNVGELESVAVSARMRRHGVGRALCKGVIEWCRSHGAHWMQLEVRVGSLGPIALYEELGFIATGRRPAYYRDPVEDALLMKIELHG